MTPAEIKALRKRLDISQAKLGKRLGVRQATVADWERGKHPPSPMAEKLLKLFIQSLKKEGI